MAKNLHQIIGRRDGGFLTLKPLPVGVVPDGWTHIVGAFTGREIPARIASLHRMDVEGVWPVGV